MVKIYLIIFRQNKINHVKQIEILEMYGKSLNSNYQSLRIKFLNRINISGRRKWWITRFYNLCQPGVFIGCLFCGRDIFWSNQWAYNRASRSDVHEITHIWIFFVVRWWEFWNRVCFEQRGKRRVSILWFYQYDWISGWLKSGVSKTIVH